MSTTLRFPSALLRMAAVFGLPLLLATSAAAQTGTEAPAVDEQVAPAKEDAPAQMDTPALNRRVRQELSKAQSSPDAPARKEEPPKEETGPVLLQPYVEPEAPATPQH